ncbi:hypothetical protein HYY72_01755 [Candidatus Woesearchaeota archaeon]|nr:hypothetical protein [Candidatus Woesearchaeota archaeon]
MNKTIYFEKAAYWLAIITGCIAIFLLAWKVFGHSPDFNALVSGLTIANITAVIGVYYKLGAFSKELRYETRFCRKSIFGLESRMDSFSSRMNKLELETKRIVRK